MRSVKNSQLAQVAVLLLFLLALVWYVSNSWSQFQNITISDPWFMLLACAFIVMNIFTIGVVVEIAMEPHGVKVTRKELFGLSAITRFANQIAPGYLGAGIRAVYFKRNYSVSFSKFSSSFILSNLLQFVISGVIVVALYLTSFNGGNESQPFLVVVFALAFFTGLLYAPSDWLARFFQNEKDHKRGKFLNQLSKLISEFNRIKKHPGLLLRTILWMNLTLISSTAIIASIYQSLGYSIGIPEALFIASFATWSIIFSITPANIGVREGLMVVAARIAGVPIPITVSVAILFRVITIAVVALLSLYFAPTLLGVKLSKLKEFASTD